MRRHHRPIPFPGPIPAGMMRISADIPDEGLDVECAASFDNLGPQPVAMLTRRIGHLDDARSRICTALAALADC